MDLGDLCIHLTELVKKGSVTLESAIERVKAEATNVDFTSEEISALDDLTDELVSEFPELATIWAELVYAIAEVSADSTLLGYCAFSLAKCRGEFGLTDEAISLYKQALSCLEGIDIDFVESTLGALGYIYVALDQYEPAISCYQRALSVSQTEVDRGGWLGNIGIAYSTLGEYQLAIDYLNQALGIFRQLKDEPAQEKYLEELGNVYHHLGQQTKAIEYYQQALIFSRNTNDDEAEARCLGNLGAIYNESEDYPKAIEYSEQALSLIQGHYYLYEEVRLESNLGNLYEFRLLDMKQAYLHYKHSIERVEQQREFLWQETHKLAFLEQRVKTYPRIIGCCQQLGRKAEAFEYAERGKSRAFLDLLGSVELPMPPHVDEKLIKKEAELHRKLRGYRAMLQRDADNSIEIVKKINAANEELERFLGEITLIAPDYVELRRSQPLSYEQVKGLLKND